MANYRTSRIIPSVLAIIIIIVAIAGLVGLARLLFGGSTQTETVSQTQVAEQNLLNASDGRAVSMTVRGPIVAQEDFRSYKIVISPSSRDFQAYTGYLNTITSQQTLPNNTTAYEEFVNALNKANFVAGTPFEGEQNNLLGICATGTVYEFNTLLAGQSQEMLWTSTCNGSRGSLKANVTQVSQLFLNQIPEGSNIAASLKL
ncbi:MAG: hypothetical protein WAR37_02665 [Candidatus Microsaccharimonas sp.]